MIALIRSSLDATPRDVNALCRATFFFALFHLPVGSACRPGCWRKQGSAWRAKLLGCACLFCRFWSKAAPNPWNPHSHQNAHKIRNSGHHPHVCPLGTLGASSIAGLVECGGVCSILVFALISWYERVTHHADAIRYSEIQK